MLFFFSFLSLEVHKYLVELLTDDGLKRSFGGKKERENPTDVHIIVDRWTRTIQYITL